MNADTYKQAAHGAPLHMLEGMLENTTESLQEAIEKAEEWRKKVEFLKEKQAYLSSRVAAKQTERYGEPLTSTTSPDSNRKPLDEKGFVFVEYGRVYWIAMCLGSPWLFSWNGDGWVSLRPVNQTQIWAAYDMRLTDKQAQGYHDKHTKNSDNQIGK